VNGWEWDAPGEPVSACGLTDSEETAKTRAEACLLSGQADTATVRAVLVRAGGTSLEDAIVPAGRPVTGYRNGPGVTWKAAADSTVAHSRETCDQGGMHERPRSR
jgi:hypothetical protein